MHMTLKIGAGRSLESREEVGEMLFALIKAHFANLMAARYLALSFELDELHLTLNYKTKQRTRVVYVILSPLPLGGLGEGNSAYPMPLTSSSPTGRGRKQT